MKGSETYLLRITERNQIMWSLARYMTLMLCCVYVTNSNLFQEITGRNFAKDQGSANNILQVKLKQIPHVLINRYCWNTVILINLHLSYAVWKHEGNGLLSKESRVFALMFQPHQYRSTGKVAWFMMLAVFCGLWSN